MTLKLTIVSANAVKLYRDKALQFQNHWFVTSKSYAPLADAFNISIASVDATDTESKGYQATLTYMEPSRGEDDVLLSGDIQHDPKPDGEPELLTYVYALSSLLFATMQLMMTEENGEASGTESTTA